MVLVPDWATDVGVADGAGVVAVAAVVVGKGAGGATFAGAAAGVADGAVLVALLGEAIPVLIGALAAGAAAGVTGAGAALCAKAPQAVKHKIIAK